MPWLKMTKIAAIARCFSSWARAAADLVEETLSRYEPEAIDTVIRLMRKARLESVRLRAA